jgi:sulfur-oxidizing protein SoxZ
VSQLGTARARVPERVKRGTVFEVRAMVEHPMESGFRLNNVGKPIPRHIVESFTCEYDGHEVFRAKLHPAISTNPYFRFSILATNSGALTFTWTDDRGGVATHVARIEVTD